MNRLPNQHQSDPSLRDVAALSLMPWPRRRKLAAASFVLLAGVTSTVWAESLGRGGDGGVGVGAVNSPGAGYGLSASPAHTGSDPTIGGGGGGGGAGGGYGGDGGIAIYPIGGGAGGLLWGENGQDGSAIGSGGGGGGGGGAHGFVGTVIDSSAVVPAGAGGAGASSGLDGGGGGGGAGGYGAVVTSGGLNTGLIRGGVGGAGGIALNGGGGGGGQGGNGLYVTGTGSVTNMGTISGGNGGVGGAAGGSLYGSGAGADGGAGVVFAAGGTLDNQGTIQGGNGSVGGDVNQLSSFGYGGEGVKGSNLTVTNSGLIAGGLSPDGVHAFAVSFTGGNNVLELRSGYAFSGDVVAVGGGTNLLRLGGSTNASFNVGQLWGFPAALDEVTQYVGFNSFEKTGSSTWTLTGTTTNASTWSVKAGTLVVNGSIAGNVSVDNGATLSGTGTVGTTSLAAGATMAPGDNSIGTLHVNGDLTFNSASTYRVKAAADGTSDRVVVSGTAHLDGSVVHVGPNGNFAPAQSYVILSAGTLDGTFNSVQSDLPFLNAGLSYGAHDVSLTLTRNQVAFITVGQTGNQRATAAALDSLPASNALATQISTLSGSQALAAYDALSGEVHASTVAGLYGIANTVSSLPLNQLRANLQAGWLPGTPTAQVSGPVDASALPRSAAQPLWAQVFGNWQSMDGNSNSAGLKQSQGGLFIGGDAPVGDGWRAGGAFGYADGRTDVDARASYAKTKSYSLSAYGGKAFRADVGTFNVQFGGAWTWHDVSSRRSIQVGALNQELSADYDASTAQLFAEAGYALPLSKSVTIEPFVGWAWNQLRSDGFTESGGSAALTADSERSHVMSSTLGLRATRAFGFGTYHGSLQAMAGWRRAYGDVSPQSTLRFADSTTFTTVGVPIARDSLAVSFGAQVAMSERTSMALSYDGQFGEGNRQNAVRMNVNWRF